MLHNLVFIVALVEGTLFLLAQHEAGELVLIHFHVADVVLFRFVVDESTQGTRVGIPKGEDELTAFIDQCIDELRAEGTIDKWYDEYSDYARTLGVD